SAIRNATSAAASGTRRRRRSRTSGAAVFMSVSVISSASSGTGQRVDRDVRLRDDGDLTSCDEDMTVVGYCHDVLVVAGGDQDGDAAVGEAPQHLIDLLACAHVDTACGFCEHEDVTVLLEPAPEQDLLLVAARERRDYLPGIAL